MTDFSFPKLRKRVAATLSALIIVETLLPAIAFAAPPTFTATQTVANAPMILQVETLDVPRTLASGDSVSLTVSGTVVTQNFQISHLATMNALASLASGMPNVSATYDSVNDRLVFDISTANPTPVSLTVGRSPVSSSNVVANVVAVAQVARVDVPQALIPGDVVSLSVAGTGISVSFSGSDAATLSSLEYAIDALSEVTATLSGRSVTVTAAVAGTAFGISNLTVVSSDVAAAPVVANVVPVAQVERLTLSRPIYAGDVVALSLSGVNLSQSFSGDTTTTMDLLASQADQLSFVNAAYSAGDLTVTSATPGTPFALSNLTISGSSVPSITVQNNNVAVAQRDVAVFPRQTVAGDTVHFSVNASSLTQTFSGSHVQTMSGLVAQISALPNLSASFDSVLNVVTVDSTVPGTAFTLNSAQITSSLSSVSSQVNVAAVAQVESLTFGRDFVAGDQVSVVMNGNTVSQSFTGTHADTVEALRAQIAAMPNLSALASPVTRVFTVSSSLPGTGFSISNATLRNVVTPTVLQNNVQAVKQTSRFDIAPSIVAGDSLSVVIGSGSVTQAFSTDDSTTVAAFV
ncbi:MAG: SH3b protein, partial [Patescibacteria group bacterium]|nr:SH3b protein [Patescibacteria group bacterium]